MAPATCIKKYPEASINQKLIGVPSLIFKIIYIRELDYGNHYRKDKLSPEYIHS